MNEPQKTKVRALRTAGFIAAAILLFLMMVWVRVLYGSIQDYREGERLLKENQTIRAITYFDRSLHWYAPFNPYVERSAEKLWEIGELAEQDKDIQLALIAYESIRNAFYGASHFVTPGKEWIKRVEIKLHTLSPSHGSTMPASPKADPGPHALWSGVVVVGFLGWVGSLIALIMAALRQKGGRGGAIFWFGCSVLWFVVWVVGMVKA